MSSAGPPRPPGMPAYPQPPGGAKLPPMPPGMKTGGAPPMPPGFRAQRPGPSQPPSAPVGAPRYPQPPTGAPAPPMPPGMVARTRSDPVDPSAYDPTQRSAPPQAAAAPLPPPPPVANAYLRPPSADGSAPTPTFMAPPPQAGNYPMPPGGAPQGYARDEPHYGGYGEDEAYRRNYEGRDEGRHRRSGGSRYHDDDDGYRRGRGRREDRRREDRHNRGGGGGQSTQPPGLSEPTNTVWVGNLDMDTYPDQLIIQTFKEFGMVMRLAKYPEKRFCFVHFRTVDEARSAVEVLTQRASLGEAVFNYSKMCTYGPDELALAFDPNHVPTIEENGPRHGGPSASSSGGGGGAGVRRGRDADEGDASAQPPQPERRRARNEPMPPTNVLWVGSLPPFVTANTLSDLFSPFGNITRITRMDKANVGFVHFATIEECTLALQTMTGRPIEGGAVLALNYGHAARQPERSGHEAGGAGGLGAPLELLPDGFPVNESRTNAIYLGLIPADATEEEIAKLFEPFEGYISSRYVPANAIGFGHFDSVEHALRARIALHGQLLHGTPLRVMFAKTNHNQSLADRRGGAEAGGFGADGAVVGPDGALILSSAGGGENALAMLPARGGGGAAGGDGSGASAGATSAYTRARPPPTETLESRLQTLLAMSYNQCGASGSEMSPSQIEDLCRVVDYCVDESSATVLDETVSVYLPSKATHAFNVVAKRMLEYFKDDPHKRLLILYAVSRAMLGAATKEADGTLYNEAALNAYLMMLMVASENQTPSGLDRLTSILESLRHHSFLQKKCLISAAYVEELGKHFDEMMERVKAEQDLASLLSGGKGI